MEQFAPSQHGALTGQIAVTGAARSIGSAVCRAALALDGGVVGIGPTMLPAHPSLLHVARPITGHEVFKPHPNGASVLIHAAGRGALASTKRFSGAGALEEVQLSASVLKATAAIVALVSSGSTTYGKLSCLDF